MIPAVFILCTLALANASPTLLRHEDFHNFKLAHAKEYDSPEEERMRLHVFSDNLRKIEAHNELHERGLKTYTMGVNQFTDMTPQEFVDMLNLQGAPSSPDNATLFSAVDLSDAPASADWRQSGIVTEVKNQGQCGSCWSFSTTGAVEGAYARATGQLVSLSEQNLVDCDSVDHGCQGGFMANAFSFIVQNGGIASEAAYPYTGAAGQCENLQRAATIRGYQNVAADEESLRQAVGTVGPVSVAVDATYYQYYRGGIFYEPGCSSTNLNHGVLVVGYGNDGQYDYWLIKNSWGPSWGEQGYIRSLRNYGNHCGVASNTCFPVV